VTVTLTGRNGMSWPGCASAGCRSAGSPRGWAAAHRRSAGNWLVTLVRAPVPTSRSGRTGWRGSGSGGPSRPGCPSTRGCARRCSRCWTGGSPPGAAPPPGQHARTRRQAVPAVTLPDGRDRENRPGRPPRARHSLAAQRSPSRSYVLAALRALHLDTDLPRQDPAPIRRTGKAALATSLAHHCQRVRVLGSARIARY